MPRIPVNKEDFPLEIQKMDETVVYRTVVKKLSVADKTDKNDNQFLKLDAEVIEPVEWRGRHIVDNWIVIPPPITFGMVEGDRRAAEDLGVRMARMLSCYRVPHAPEGWDTEAAVGCVGDVTLKNEDFEGRPMARVKDYLI